MAHQDAAERFPIGRTALGGAACGFTYDAAMQDVVAREQRLRRPLRLERWERAGGRLPTADRAGREAAEPVRADHSA
jgi:hypothetical protein